MIFFETSVRITFRVRSFGDSIGVFGVFKHADFLFIIHIVWTDTEMGTMFLSVDFFNSVIENQMWKSFWQNELVSQRSENRSVDLKYIVKIHLRKMAYTFVHLGDTNILSQNICYCMLIVTSLYCSRRTGFSYSLE